MIQSSTTIQEPRIVWLASYPRSGNTLLRTILWHCFSCKSGSYYKYDNNLNGALKKHIGHLDSHEGKILFPKNSIPLVKTHGKNIDLNPAIYLVRDGRAACFSLWQYYEQKVDIRFLIEGDHLFGTWTDHVESWHPWERSNTLFLKFEELIQPCNLSIIINQLSDFLEREPITYSIPSQDVIGKLDADWAKKATRWQSVLKGNLLDRFYEINRVTMERLNYV